MTYPSVLPPASTPLEKAAEQVAAYLVDLPVPVRDVWSPQHCPEGHLPWLAWGLAITHWDTAWSLPAKRDAVAEAIPYHRRKGSRRSVEEVLARHHPAFRLVEWHEAIPPREPHTFEVRASAAEVPVSLLAAMGDAIVRDVAAAKPLRSHFDFVQTFDARTDLFLTAGGVGVSIMRQDADASHDTSRNWSAVLQTETGEPIYLAAGGDVLEEAA